LLIPKTDLDVAGTVVQHEILHIRSSEVTCLFVSIDPYIVMQLCLVLRALLFVQKGNVKEMRTFEKRSKEGIEETL
jgi:hypothetical protein